MKRILLKIVVALFASMAGAAYADEQNFPTGGFIYSQTQVSAIMYFCKKNHDLLDCEFTQMSAKAREN